MKRNCSLRYIVKSNPIRLIILVMLFIMASSSVKAANPHGIQITPEEGEYYSLTDFILFFPETVEYVGGDTYRPNLELPDGNTLPLEVSYEGMSYESCRLILPYTINTPGLYRLMLPDGAFRIALDYLNMPTDFQYQIIDPNAGIQPVEEKRDGTLWYSPAALPATSGIVIDTYGVKKIRHKR